LPHHPEDHYRIEISLHDRTAFSVNYCVARFLAIFTAIFLTAIDARAATLQGVVVDWDTGRPLARTVLNLEAIQGGQTVSRNALRADRYGVFTFKAIAPGIYLLTASRTAFATQQYGQKGWNRPGTPLLIEGDQPIGIQIRLRRLASITGTVWDENQVGVPGVPIVIYTATRPVKIAARVVTDDRGIYRAGELVPGSYIVRNAAKLLDDGVSVLPTFYPDGFSLGGARLVEVDLDRSVTDINFQPAQGRLFHISGHVVSSTRSSGTSGTIDLISDTGRVSAGYDENGAFSFDSVAPGVYELFVQNAQHQAAWHTLRVDRDRGDVRLTLVPLRPSWFNVERDGIRADTATVSLFARRKDLDADGPVIPFISNRTELAPGNWEVAVSTPPDTYPKAVFPYNEPVNVTPNSRADGWNRLNQPGQFLYLRVVLSSHTASLNGRVVSSLNDAAALVPVFLETLDLDPSEAPQIRNTRTDQLGQYRFAGLPPGRYRVFSSYEVDPSNRSSIESTRPKIISLRDSANAAQDLELVYQ
jgi:protocatechuate 3,4-dioxygenase beta subunit